MFTSQNLALQGLILVKQGFGRRSRFTNRTGSEGNSDNEKFYGA